MTPVVLLAAVVGFVTAELLPPGRTVPPLGEPAGAPDDGTPATPDESPADRKPDTPSGRPSTPDPNGAATVPFTRHRRMETAGADAPLTPGTAPRHPRAPACAPRPGGRQWNREPATKELT